LQSAAKLAEETGKSRKNASPQTTTDISQSFVDPFEIETMDRLISTGISGFFMQIVRIRVAFSQTLYFLFKVVERA